MSLWINIKAGDNDMGENLLLVIGRGIHQCQGAHVEIGKETRLIFHFVEAESLLFLGTTLQYYMLVGLWTSR